MAWPEEISVIAPALNLGLKVLLRSGKLQMIVDESYDVYCLSY